MQGDFQDPSCSASFPQDASSYPPLSSLSAGISKTISTASTPDLLSSHTSISINSSPTPESPSPDIPRTKKAPASRSASPVRRSPRKSMLVQPPSDEAVLNLNDIPTLSNEPESCTLPSLAKTPRKSVSRTAHAKSKAPGDEDGEKAPPASPRKRNSVDAELDRDASPSERESAPTPSPTKKPRKATTRKTAAKSAAAEEAAEEEKPVSSPRKRAASKARSRAKSVSVACGKDDDENPSPSVDDDAKDCDDTSSASNVKTFFNESNAADIPGNLSSKALSQHAVQFLINTIVESATAEKKWNSWAKMMKECGSDISGAALKKQMEKVWLARLQGMYKQ